jgi:hypothetical protein
VAKTIAVGFTVAAVFAVAQIEVNRGERGAQASAIGALRAISSAQSIYASVNGGYARSLHVLSMPCPGGGNGFISPDIAKDPAVRGGYQIRLQATAPLANARGDCNGEPMASTYYATAVPLRRSPGFTAAFAVDELQIIWYDSAGTALVPPFREGGTVRALTDVARR